LFWPALFALEVFLELGFMRLHDTGLFAHDQRGGEGANNAISACLQRTAKNLICSFCTTILARTDTWEADTWENEFDDKKAECFMDHG